jgi:hypothetical protein
LIIKLPILLSGLLLAGAADTVWWNGRAGSVVEHRDQHEVICTLTLKDERNRLTFAWSNHLPLRVVFDSGALRLAPDQIAQIAVRIGDVWLAHGNGKPNIAVMTAASSVMFILNERVEEALLQARDIGIRAADQYITMTLMPNGVKDLVDAVRRCNAVIAQSG